MTSEQLPNQDVRISEEFVRDHEPLLIFLWAKLLGASLETGGAVDADVQEALGSLIRTYRTLESGLYYETRPNNLLAANIHQKIQDSVQELRKNLVDKGLTPIRDAELLGILVFLERVGLRQRNGRPRGRAFINYLLSYFPRKQTGLADAPSLIQV